MSDPITSTSPNMTPVATSDDVAATESAPQCSATQHAPTAPTPRSAGTESLVSQHPSQTAAFADQQTAQEQQDAAHDCRIATMLAVGGCAMMTLTPGGPVAQFLAGATCGTLIADAEYKCDKATGGQ